MERLYGKQAFTYLEKYPDSDKLGWIDLRVVSDEYDEMNMTVEKAKALIAEGKYQESEFCVDAMDEQEARETLIKMYLEWIEEYSDVDDIEVILGNQTHYYVNESLAIEVARKMVSDGLFITRKRQYESESVYDFSPSSMSDGLKLQRLVRYVSEKDNKYSMDIDWIVLMLKSIGDKQETDIEV